MGQDIKSNQRALDIAAAYPGFVYPALGLHPWNIRAARVDAELEFIQANIDKAVAVGEIGLDYHKGVRENADKPLQKEVLGRLLEIALRHGKPAAVHSRYAWRDAYDIVLASGVKKVVFHWFTGPSSVLREVIAAGYYLSATPAAAYHEEHRRAVKECPPDRLLLETDSPVTYARGTAAEFRAQPADVARSLSAVALARNTTEADLAAVTTANARTLFGF